MKPSKRELLIRLCCQIAASYVMGYYYHICPPWGRNNPFEGWEWYQGLTCCWITGIYFALWIANINRLTEL